MVFKIRKKFKVAAGPNHHPFPGACPIINHLILSFELQ
jgi:hypothetical protein